jgi:C-terminal processing protease CtpA/Prc
MKKKWYVFMFLCVSVWSLCSGGCVDYVSRSRLGANSSITVATATTEEKDTLRYLSEVYAIMTKAYYKDIANERTLQFFLHDQLQAMNLLDRHSRDYKKDIEKLKYWRAAWIVEVLKDPTDVYSGFLYKDRVASFEREHFKNSFVSIGLELELKEGKFLIAKVYDNTSAKTANVLAGDELLAVNGVNVRGKTFTVVENLLMVAEGSSVKLSLRHSGEKKAYDVTLIAHVVWIPSVEYQYYPDTGDLKSVPWPCC